MSRERDERHMRRALAAARCMLGQTWPNPAVGCVIVKGDDVLAQAATAPGGRPHAEEQALAQAGDAARGATVFISLEPCGQRSNGLTSCSDLLAHAGVARVMIAADNPEAMSAGRGLAHLQAAGVPVELGFLADEAEPLYRGFRHKLRTGLPLVEAAEDGAGFDGPFQMLAGEDPAAALKRLAQAGYTRLWTPRDEPLAAQLAVLGLLT